MISTLHSGSGSCAERSPGYLRECGGEEDLAALTSCANLKACLCANLSAVVGNCWVIFPSSEPQTKSKRCALPLLGFTVIYTAPYTSYTVYIQRRNSNSVYSVHTEEMVKQCICSLVYSVETVTVYVQCLQCRKRKTEYTGLDAGRIMKRV